MFLRHFALLGLAVACVAQSRSATNPGSDWRVTGGDAGNSRYSTLDQISRRDVGGAYIVATSPGVIYDDLLIQGTRVGEEEGSAPGDIRAYDVHTGRIRWTFHTIPRPGEVGYDTWPSDAWKTAGGANSWAGMSVDVARGIVYIPTGSATPD